MTLRAELAATLDHCAETRLGLPRVDWDRLFGMLSEHARASPQALPLLGELWLERLRDGGPPGARLAASRNFAAISWRAAGDAERVLKVAEAHRTGILRFLRGIAHELSPLRLPLLLFADYERYVDYTADMDADEGEIATSGGMFVGDGFPHVVLPARAPAIEEGTLAHELTHAHLTHLALPLWLNEGFATVMEKSLLGRGSAFSPAEAGDHREYWDEETIQGFWSGAVFRDVRGQRLAYALAELSMRVLAKDYARLARFAVAARREDAGEGAFRAAYGRGLETLLVGLLGEGPWQPVPWRW